MYIIILGVIWWLLTGGGVFSWIMGVPAVFFALLFIRKRPAYLRFHVNIIAIPGFLVFFFYQSLLSGLDVAKRALHPRCPLSPDFIVYPLRLKTPFSQIFFVNTISLLPGTLSADLQDHAILVHVLDRSYPVIDALKRLERKVGALLEKGRFDG